jgi:hypothetical protein
VTAEDLPVGTVMRNPASGTTYVKTHHDPGACWLAAPRGRAQGRLTSAAVGAIPGLVEMVEVTL